MWYEQLPSEQNFSYRDLFGQDRWLSKTLTSAEYSFTIVGSPAFNLRHRVIGRKCEFQLQIDCSGGNTVACTAGTHYFSLPVPAKGYGGTVMAFDASTKIAHGSGGIDVTNSRAYPASWAASTVDVVLSGWYEV